MTITNLNHWSMYPNAVPNYQTDNQSFLDVHSKLEQKGVKNCNFFLAVNNPETKLSVSESHESRLDQIHQEITTNFWYYLREIVNYELDEQSLALCWNVLNNKDVYVNRSRGRSKAIIHHLITWLTFASGKSDQKTLAVYPNQNQRFDSLEYATTQYEKLLASKLGFEDLHKDGIYSLAQKEQNNSILGYVSQRNAQSAENLGRGMSTNLIVFFDAGEIDYLRHTVPAAMASSHAAKMNIDEDTQGVSTIISFSVGWANINTGIFLMNELNRCVPWENKMYDENNASRTPRVFIHPQN